MQKRTKFLLVALLAIVAAFVMAACAADTGGEGDGDGDGGEAGEAEGDGVVNIFGAFVDSDAENFEAAMAPFEEETGIDIVYEGSGDFETLINTRVDGGDPPDIAAFPQPGAVRSFVEDGAIVPATEFMDMAYLQDNYTDSWITDATFNDTVAGVWYRANVKSLVWYPVPEFSEAGYEIPETWDELIALSDQMVADGNTPWCIGIESSGATGWVATDWMEDTLLRTAPPETYDQWVSHEIPFDDPAIQNAANTVGEIWFNDDYVLGGQAAILTTPFGDAPTPMFDDEPSCYLHRQASFITGFFPDDVVVGEDVDFFYFPQIDAEYGEPVLTAGDIFTAFVDDPDVAEVMRYLATAESTQAWVEAGGFVSPHTGASLDWYPTDVDRAYAEILQNADTSRFDASDLMPPAVGSGTFWEGMVNWVDAGGENTEEVLGNIEASWPTE